jgi:hypothetical protein
MTIDEFMRKVPSEEPVAILAAIIKRWPTIEFHGAWAPVSSQAWRADMLTPRGQHPSHLNQYNRSKAHEPERYIKYILIR